MDLLYWKYPRWIDIFSCSSNNVGIIAIMGALLLFVRFLTELVQHRKFVVDFWFVFISPVSFFLLHNFSLLINLHLLLLVDSWLEKVLNKFRSHSRRTLILICCSHVSRSSTCQEIGLHFARGRFAVRFVDYHALLALPLGDLINILGGSFLPLLLLHSKFAVNK